VEITDFSGNVMSQKDFAFKEFRVRATPMLAFFDLDGKLIHRHTGRTSDADEFMLMGRFIAEGKYKETKFARYKRAQKK
jgi:thioredoxin-related protein